MLFWQSIQDSDSPALFEAYLKTFPNGVFAPIAKEKIEGLKEKEVLSSTPSEVPKSRLFVKAEPGNARVRILNIVPKFYQGMELDPGRYHVEVSSNGYETMEMWERLEAGKDETLRFTLKKNTVPQKGISQQPDVKEDYSPDRGQAAPVPESPEIHADNTAIPAGGNRWDWTVFIRASRDVLEQINCVEYTLHPTFPNPVRTVCQQGIPDQPFALSSNGWGTFTIHIRVMMKNGQEKKLQHALRFR
jgi:hypothetical protein